MAIEPQWDEGTLAYVAGFLDGEGTFAIGGYGPSVKSSKIVVRCSNTYRPVLEWLKQLFGGSITTAKPRARKHRPCYAWCIVSRDAERLIRALLPYLKEKAPQAIGLLLFQQTMSSRGRRIQPEILEERRRFADGVSQLKGRIK